MKPLTDDFRNKHRKARAIINLLFEDNQIIHVNNLDTAHEGWLTVKNLMKEQIEVANYFFKKSVLQSS